MSTGQKQKIGRGLVHARGEQGAAVIETAMVTVVMLLLFAGAGVAA